MKTKKIKLRKKKAVSKKKVISVKDIAEILKQIEAQKKKVKKVSKKSIKKKHKVKAEEVAKKSKISGTTGRGKKKSKESVDIDYHNSILYGKSTRVDYEQLFSYLGKEYKDPYKMFIESLKERDGLGSNDIITEQELEKIIKKDQVNAMIGNHLNKSSYEDREKYKYWKSLNRMMNMVLIGMNQMGENAGLGVFYI